jgi:hypothetical protein
MESTFRLAHRFVVALTHAVDVHRPREVRRGFEQVQLLLHEQRVRTQVDELLPLHQLGRDLVDLGMDQRLAAGDRDHGRAALFDRRHRTVHRHALLQDVRGVLDLAAAGAREVAREQRLQFDQQREPLSAGQLLLDQVGPHTNLLPRAHRHVNAPPSARPAA